MLTNTKTLFVSILKAIQADCVCDIGSRDGDQSLLFRHLLPEAQIAAFEANPPNFERMKADQRLRDNRIEVFPYAISNENGRAVFHISDVDYSNSEENRGTSSLLVHEGLPLKASVEVETRRIDDFIMQWHPTAQKVGLWIDVESAEYWVLEGMERIAERVVAVHVETANKPMRKGQKTLAEILPMMERYGFRPCGSNISAKSDWGDVVWVNRAAARRLGLRFFLCKARAYAGYWVRADHVAVFLKGRAPWAYRLLRRIYLRLGT